MSSPALQVDDLRHTYRRGRKTALDGVSFSVNSGEIFGLLGPNGAGKTTIVKILTTILRPTSGRAFVNGSDVVRDPLGARRQLTAVLQESAVEIFLSVWDNLLLYAQMHGLSRADARRRAGEVSDILELGQYRATRAQALSGGYKRRLQVAKALMVDSPVLFLDEATTGMDPLVKRRVVQSIRDQVARGRTVLLTTQLLDEAESLCDRMLLLDRGRSLAEGTLSDLRALSTRMFRIQLSFSDCSEEAFAAVRALAPRTFEERDGEIEMTVTGTEDQWIRHMAAISERWPLAHLEFRGANLEQIFVELYGDAEKKEGSQPGQRLATSD